MKNKKVISIIAIIMAILMALSLIISVLPVMASAVSQEEIDAATRKRDELQAQVDEKQAVVDQLEAEHAGVLATKLAMDERNEYCRQQIEANNDIIDIYVQMIAEKELEVSEAKRLEDEQLERYRTRVRAMEENGNYNYVSLILSAESLSDLLTLIDDIGEIMQSDRHLEDEYIAARQNTEQVKAEYEEYKAGIEEKVAELESESADLEAKIDEANKLIAEIVDKLDAEEEKLAEIEAVWSAADDKVNSLIAQMEAERKAAEEAAAAAAHQEMMYGEVQGTGSWKWPVACKYITSRVGGRVHPVTGVYKYHSGMDIGCAYGDTVWAADDGTVCLAGVNGGYGNCVMINHGNGYYTLYGHLSSISVSEGTVVSKGNTIGAVGSSGVSTGPHLHFEIRYGGECLEFNDWFGGLTFAPDA